MDSEQKRKSDNRYPFVMNEVLGVWVCEECLCFSSHSPGCFYGSALPTINRGWTWNPPKD